jgi:hypothetical protein
MVPSYRVGNASASECMSSCGGQSSWQEVAIFVVITPTLASREAQLKQQSSTDEHPAEKLQEADISTLCPLTNIGIVGTSAHLRILRTQHLLTSPRAWLPRSPQASPGSSRPSRWSVTLMVADGDVTNTPHRPIVMRNGPPWSSKQLLNTSLPCL